MSKKETAKVVPPPSSKAPLPQATVQLKKEPASASKSVSTPAITVAQPQAPAPAGAEELSPVLGAAALILSLAALAVQVWILIS
ncbi:MAG: hypothetical protein N2322_01265 [Terrimicrobiaceae bacterium]|nr:hypothetical protein [Terrimicrobiaceae bacterium]